MPITISEFLTFTVSEALPLMLTDNPAGADKKIILNWLDKAFQYYVVTTLMPNKEGRKVTGYKS